MILSPTGTYLGTEVSDLRCPAVAVSEPRRSLWSALGPAEGPPSPCSFRVTRSVCTRQEASCRTYGGQCYRSPPICEHRGHPEDHARASQPERLGKATWSMTPHSGQVERSHADFAKSRRFRKLTQVLQVLNCI